VETISNNAKKTGFVPAGAKPAIAGRRNRTPVTRVGGAETQRRLGVNNGTLPSALAARDPASDPSRHFPARRLPLTPPRAEPAPASGVVRANRRACAPDQREIDMDWNRVEGNWKQVKGKIKEKWGNLTDDDLDKVNGRRDQLEGRIQERYGLARDRVRRDVDDWLKMQP
jgi:uncharacterized protein YjbJ (UPF0337 family)